LGSAPSETTQSETTSQNSDVSNILEAISTIETLTPQSLQDVNSNQEEDGGEDNNEGEEEDQDQDEEKDGEQDEEEAMVKETKSKKTSEKKRVKTVGKQPIMSQRRRTNTEASFNTQTVAPTEKKTQKKPSGAWARHKNGKIESKSGKTKGMSAMKYL